MSKNKKEIIDNEDGTMAEFLKNALQAVLVFPDPRHPHGQELPQAQDCRRKAYPERLPTVDPVDKLE